MFRTLQRAVVATVALTLAGIGLVATPAGAADCGPGVPSIRQFSMSPPTITAPTGERVETSTLAAQVDACGAEGLVLRVDVTSPNAQTHSIADFGQNQAPDGTRSTELFWQAGDVGTWQFTLLAEAWDPNGVMQTASVSLDFIVAAPAPAPQPAFAVPGAPRSLTVTKRSPTSGKVSWVAPASDGGATISGYRIAKPGADVTVKGTARSYTVKGLKPGRRYSVTIKARNIQGYGPTSVIVLKTRVTTPTKPRALRVAKRTRTSGKIAWSAPSSNGGATITGYRIVKPGADVTVKRSARSYTVKGLKAGRSYTIKVKAKNAQGYGPSTVIRLKTRRAASRSCTPGYTPCLPPASDYDCAGGSGNGPRFVDGEVLVSGSDPYDLDRDGNGIGCES